MFKNYLTHKHVFIFCVVLLVTVCSVVTFRRPRVPSLTVSDINSILKKIYEIPKSDYENVFKDKKIKKEIVDTTFSESIRSRMNVPTDFSLSTMDMHVFMNSKDNQEFIDSQYNRFQVPEFGMLARKIIVPIFTDAIIKQLNYYSEYSVGGSRIIFYTSGMYDADNVFRKIIDVYAMMVGLVDFEVEAEIHILLTDLKKKSIPGKPIGTPQMLNSGMKFSNKIIIWRTEEVVKVFIHEMVHLLGLDLGHNKSSYKLGNIDLGVKFSLGSASSPGEAFTETVTRILYTRYKTETFDEFHEEFKNQSEWSMKQAARVLHLNDGVTKTITQTTYMYEYYILTALFMHTIVTHREMGVYLNYFRQNRRRNKISASDISIYLSEIDPTHFLEDLHNLVEEIPESFGKKERTLMMTPI